MSVIFDPDCRRCPRLAAFLDDVRQAHPDYHAAPVAPFGDADPRLLIVGLAPGMHGANRTGRPFTGDYAGVLLYKTLHKFGYATAPESTAAGDNLRLSGARITNAVKCLPPQNKPVGAEVSECSRYLIGELKTLRRPAVVLALGGIAHRTVVRCLGLRQKDHAFGHGAVHELDGGLTLVDSYHCSRYNTQTRRLTEPMFEAVFEKIGELAAA